MLSSTYTALVLRLGPDLQYVEGLWDIHEKPAACYRRDWSVWWEGVLEATPSDAKEGLPGCFL